MELFKQPQVKTSDKLGATQPQSNARRHEDDDYYDDNDGDGDDGGDDDDDDDDGDDGDDDEEEEDGEIMKMVVVMMVMIMMMTIVMIMMNPSHALNSLWITVEQADLYNYFPCCLKTPIQKSTCNALVNSIVTLPRPL